MWIRSQDKEMLLNCEGFDILDEDTVWIIYGCNTALATYSTEEKALKVLDMIEKHLNSQGKIVKKSMGNYFISDVKLNVFQMPQDEEMNEDIYMIQEMVDAVLGGRR